MATQEKTINATVFYELARQPQYADKSLELIDGAIIEMPKPGGLHGEILSRFVMYLTRFVIENNLGRTTTGETGFITIQNPDGRDRVRGIDAAFISYERSPDPLPSGLIPFMPNLAVEVISPGNAAEDIHEKVMELLTAGTDMVWVIYPNTRTVVVHNATGAKTFTENDTLIGADVLPGFELSVNQIFPSN